MGTREELASAWDALHRAPCVLEQRLQLALECSVVLARGRDGAIVHLPVQRNLHRAGILAVTEVLKKISIKRLPVKRWKLQFR